MRTGSTPAKSRTILCMRAVPGMARGVRRRLLPQPSRLGRRRIVLTGPSLPSPLLLSGLQSCRRLVRRHQNRDRRPLWVIGLPCQTRGRSLRQADYPQLPRSTHPTTNLAATSSPLSCDDFIEYAHFQTVIDMHRAGDVPSAVNAGAMALDAVRKIPDDSGQCRAQPGAGGNRRGPARRGRESERELRQSPRVRRRAHRRRERSEGGHSFGSGSRTAPACPPVGAAPGGWASGSGTMVEM